MTVDTEHRDPVPALSMEQIGQLDPDWWAHRACQAMRRTHYRILNDHEPLPELIKLRERVDWLIDIGERTAPEGGTR